MTVKFPLVFSPRSEERRVGKEGPLAAAVHEQFEVHELNVQVKSAEAPGAKLATLAGVKPVLHAPPPVTLTFVMAVSPVFFSVTTTVMVVFGPTVVPGETLLVVSVVAG